MEMRRSSVGHSQGSALDAMSFASCLEDAVSNAAAASGILSPSPVLPNVPPIVLTCIRHLEHHGLRTVGIFRVSSSKKRVRQVSEAP